MPRIRIVVLFPAFVGKRQASVRQRKDRTRHRAAGFGSEIDLAKRSPADAAIRRFRQQRFHRQHAGGFRIDEGKLGIRAVDPDECAEQSIGRQLGEIA